MESIEANSIETVRAEFLLQACRRHLRATVAAAPGSFGEEVLRHIEERHHVSRESGAIEL